MINSSKKGTKFRPCKLNKYCVSEEKQNNVGSYEKYFTCLCIFVFYSKDKRIFKRMAIITLDLLGQRTRNSE